MKRSEMVERVKFITHGSSRILRFDFSHLDIEDAREVIEYGSRMVARMPKKSVLTLTDVTGANFNKDLTEELKKFTSNNKPHVIAGAVVGVAGLKRIIFQGVVAASGRADLRLFDDAGSAQDWLAGFRE